MKKVFRFPVALSLLAFTQVTYAQRYSSEVYSSVKVSKDVVYGNNKSVLTGTPTSMDLKMDVYEPVGVTAAERPLILFLHTGGFLPQSLTKSPTGNKGDSAVVEICSRFAKRGYVAASLDYRLGWNPLASDQDVLTGTLLNAVYRAVQDVRTSIRYFKKEVSFGNSFRVDTTMIFVGGMGSGGYVSLAAAALDKKSEIELEKFINVSKNEPYVNQALTGDFNGLGGNAAVNSPNWPGHSSAINMAFNLGGALGDSSWLEKGEVPIVSFQCVLDPFAPYTSGIVTVPVTGNTVVNAFGAYEIVKKSNTVGNNQVFIDANITDAFTLRANKINDNYEGLFPFVLPATGTASANQSAPWEWWSASDPNSSSGLANNPDMSKAKAMAYIDTIVGYLSPRMIAVMSKISTGVNEAGNDQNSISVFPNPSAGIFTISVSNSEVIKGIEVTDITGRIVLVYSNINNNIFNVSEEVLRTGVYFVKVNVGDRINIKKLVVK